MSLRSLCLTLLTLFLLLATSVFLLVYRWRVRPVFAEVEKRIYAEDAETIRTFTSTRFQDMLSLLRGFAKWGDLDTFLKLSRSEQEERIADRRRRFNDFEGSFSIVLLLDLDRTVRFGLTYDNETGVYRQATDNVRRWLERDAKVIFSNPEADWHGFVCRESVPGMLATIPVVDRENGGVLGRLVAVDFIEHRVLGLLDPIVQADLKVIEGYRDPRFPAWAANADDDDIVVLDNETPGKYATVFMPKRIDGSRCFGIVLERSLGDDALPSRAGAILLLSVLGLFALLALGVVLVLELVVIKPARDLEAILKRIIGSGDVRVAVEELGRPPMSRMTEVLRQLVLGRVEDTERIDRLRNEMEQRDVRIDFLGRIMRIQSDGGADAPRRALDETSRLLELDFIQCYSFPAKGGMRTTGLFRKRNARTGARVDQLGDTVDWIARLCETPQAQVLTLDGEFPPGYENIYPIMRDYDLQTVLVLPLRAGGGVDGVLIAGRVAVGDWPEWEKKLLSLSGGLMLAMVRDGANLPMPLRISKRQPKSRRA